MFTLINGLNVWAEAWLAAVVAVLWQSTLLVALAAAVAWWLRRSSPVVRYWLWQIVAVKLLIMPFWTSAVPLPSWGQSRPPASSVAADSAADRPDDFARWIPLHGRSTSDGSDAETLASAAAPWEWLTAMTWQAWFLLAWLAVVLWQIVRLVLQRRRLTRLLQDGGEYASPRPLGEASGMRISGDCIDVVAQLSAELRLRRVPRVVLVEDDGPLFVCGLWRPRLVLPRRLMASLSSAERRQVILHELAHLKRRDLLWGWPVEIARIVYFFHPLVYWVAHQLRLERELACDQLAMAHSGHPPADYAQTLVRVVGHASDTKPRPFIASDTKPRPVVAPPVAADDHNSIFDNDVSDLEPSPSSKEVLS
jgi:beta-lactamase regulating signal transducer with metallopeptidase domain